MSRTDLVKRLRSESLYSDKATLEIMDLCMCAALEIERLETELAWYKKAEADGRLVVLPCKSGDTIYQLTNKNHARGITTVSFIQTKATRDCYDSYKMERNLSAIKRYLDEAKKLTDSAPLPGQLKIV